MPPDPRDHIAHTPKYTASADDLAELAAEARAAADPGWSRKCAYWRRGVGHG